MLTQVNTKKKWMTLLLSSLLLGLIVYMTNSKPSSSEDISHEEHTPTLFVHGYKGGTRSFQTMFDRMQALGWGAKRMTIYVSPNGKTSIQGHLPKDRAPLIQVLFQNNRASIHDQTHWLTDIMERLHERYGVQQVNLVGHSMGGLVSTNYLLNDQTSTAPSVEKLAVIASPFQGIERKGYFSNNFGDATNDLRPGSEALTQMIKNKENFPLSVDVFAIAGVINKDAPEQEHWDGLVLASSVQGLENIVPFGHYQERLIYNRQATHSGLHEWTEVDVLLGEFLWDKEN